MYSLPLDRMNIAGHELATYAMQSQELDAEAFTEYVNKLGTEMGANLSKLGALRAGVELTDKQISATVAVAAVTLFYIGEIKKLLPDFPVAKL